MKILYLYFGSASPVHKYESNLIKSINKNSTKIKIDFWNWTGDLGINFNPSLKWAYRNLDTLKSFYNTIEKRLIGYDVLFIAQTGGLIPEFLDKLKIFKIYNTADDPEASKTCSFPFLSVVDVIVHAGVSYYNNKPLEKEFYSRGAQKCYFMPIGFYNEMFPAISDFDLTFKKRNQRIVFIGRPRIKRIHLIKLFNKFKDSIRVHNRRSPIYQKYFWLLTSGINITPFEGSLAELYWSSQVGINMHLSSGPSNVRTYQLSACGVAQVIDCHKTVSAVFEPDYEILSYSNIEQAINHITNLLVDTDLRYSISKAGMSVQGNTMIEKYCLQIC